MISFVLRRIGSSVVLIASVTTLTFFLLFAAGGDVARRLLGPDATPDTVAAKAHELGLDQPVLHRFGDWVGAAVHGDLGRSWFSGQPVTEAILSRLAVTFSLAAGAILLTAVVATFLGVLAATRGGWSDRLVQVLSVLGHAVPTFLIALILVTVFAVRLHWFTPTGYTRITDSPVLWLSSVTLPILALAIGGTSGVAQQVRGAVADALRQDYVRTLRSRGVPETRVVLRHVLRNAAGPALTFLGLEFVGLIGGAVIIEQIFAIPGLGQVAVNATSQGDMPLVMGLVMTVAAFVVVVNLAIDLIQGWLNPKVRQS